MSMHLVGPHLSTTKTNSRGPKVSNTKKAKKARQEHDAWLKKQGIHPEQLAKKGKTNLNKIPNYTADLKEIAPLSNNVGNGFKKGIMHNLHKESPSVQAEILAKAARVDVAYNKGGLVYWSPGEDMSMAGNKTRR